MRSVMFAVALGAIGLVLGFAVLRADETGTPRAPTPKREIPSPVASAASFLAGLDLPRLMDDRRRLDFIAAHAEPSALRRLSSLYADEAGRVRAAFAARPRFSRAAYLGYRVERRGRADAVVSLWVVSLGGAGNAPLAVGWRTMRVRLVLLTGAWKIASVDEQPGPQPEMTADRFVPMARDFKAFRVVP